MKVILIGASGATGTFVLKELLQNNEVLQLTILVRKKIEIEDKKLIQVVVNFDDLESYMDAFDANVAISCLGTTKKVAGNNENQYKVDYTYQYEFAKITYKKGVENFILLSSMNANKNAKIFYTRIKGELEDAVSKLQFNSLFIVQPGPLIRPNSDRIGENIVVKVLLFFNKLSIAKSYKPLHVSTVAKAILKLTLSKNIGTKIIDLKNIAKLGS